MEPLAPQIARTNNKQNCAIDCMYSDAHNSLDDETIKLTSFCSVDEQFAFIRGFHGLENLSNFFTKQIICFFKTLIEQDSTLVYIQDILLLSKSKEHMVQLTKQLHIISKNVI